MKDLLEYIHSTQGVDFSHYRPATVSRKLELRLQETNCRDYHAYLGYLKTHPEELPLLIRTLTIKVSNFFRNSLVFELLQQEVLPKIIDDFKHLKAWSIGCANGEEPYTIAMIVHEMITGDIGPFVYHIQGTDLDGGAIDSARAAIYPDRELFEMKRKYIDRYFTEVNGRHETGYGQRHYHLKSEIRSMVRFSSDNIVSLLRRKRDMVGTFNIILCRNLLIYMSREVKDEMGLALLDILYDGGYLVIGESETMPDNIRHRFAQPFPGIKIFRKIPSAAAH